MPSRAAISGVRTLTMNDTRLNSPAFVRQPCTINRRNSALMVVVDPVLASPRVTVTR
jgi:hypothetical protein